MQIPIQNVDAVTPEKARWCEQQINRLMEYSSESRDILRQESHATLNWLFAILVGSTGYAVTLLSNPEQRLWYLIAPMLAASAVASIRALLLLRAALRTVSVPPVGNEPRNLLTDELLQHDLEWIQIAELGNMQERIDRTRQRNHEIGDAINQARFWIAILPFVCGAVALITFCTMA